MFEVIKNMFRRKFRTFLTVFGIAIGVLALIFMGAMAEKITKLVSGGTDYYSDKVVVYGEGGISGFGAAPLTIDKIEEVKSIQGVKAVSAVVSTTLDQEMDTANFGPPSTLSSSDGVDSRYDSFQVAIRSGRALNELEDYKKTVLGSDIASSLGADVGNKVVIRGAEYEVVGIYEKTLTAPDNRAVIPFRDAQRILHSEQPEIIKGQVKPEEIATNFYVYFKDGYDPNKLAETISANVTGVNAMSPDDFEDTVASSVGTLTSILYGIALISLLVGSLSVINTMTMSISERKREIGIKKAIGAKTKNIMSEYLFEAGLIGFLGGLLGVGAGSLIVVLVSEVMLRGGDTIFLLTPRLVIGSLVFSVVIGVIAGIYPAYHASRLSIVKSLREE